MATHDSTSTSPTPQMRPAEMAGLAARLRARAQSVVLRDCPEQQRDLQTAAGLVHRLVHVLAEVRRAADATQDEATERHLRELLGGA